MKKTSMRLVTALVTAGLVITTATSALANPYRWAPRPDIEDGALTEPVAGMAAADPESSVTSAAPRTGKKPTDKEAPVTITSPSGVLMEARSGRVLFNRNGHERRNPASVTKIMTLLVAFDALRAGKVKLTDKVTISEEAHKQVGTIIFADAGETFTLQELLMSVAVGSANDAAVAVAEHVSGSVEAFVHVMNARAKELGMQDTQFMNPTGLSADGHFTSAFDIALMSRAAAINYPELLKLTAIYGADLKVPWRKNGPVFRLWNNNKLLTWYQGADGLKTGWTEAAGYCLSATALRGTVRMIAVIMGADSWKVRNAEVAKLLDYGFANYRTVDLALQDQKMGVMSVTRGKTPEVAVIPQAPFSVCVANGEQKKVKTEIKLPKRIEAPVGAKQPVGEMVATLDGKEVGRMPLVTAQAVPKANLIQAIMLQMKWMFRFR